jgi:hypothetical protein
MFEMEVNSETLLQFVHRQKGQTSINYTLPQEPVIYAAIEEIPDFPAIDVRTSYFNRVCDRNGDLVYIAAVAPELNVVFVARS